MTVGRAAEDVAEISAVVVCTPVVAGSEVVEGTPVVAEFGVVSPLPEGPHAAIVNAITANRTQIPAVLKNFNLTLL